MQLTDVHHNDVWTVCLCRGCSNTCLNSVTVKRILPELVKIRNCIALYVKWKLTTNLLYPRVMGKLPFSHTAAGSCFNFFLNCFTNWINYEWNGFQIHLICQNLDYYSLLVLGIADSLAVSTEFCDWSYREAVVATIHTHPATVKKKAKRQFKKRCQIRNERC